MTSTLKLIVAAIASTVAAPLLYVCLPVVWKAALLATPPTRFFVQYPAYNILVASLLAILAGVLLKDFVLRFYRRVRAKR